MKRETCPRAARPNGGAVDRYAKVTKLVRAAYLEYKRVDSEGDRDTFADFVDGVTSEDVLRFVERRIEGWPEHHQVRVRRAIDTHRALGSALASLLALVEEPKELSARRAPATDGEGDG